MAFDGVLQLNLKWSSIDITSLLIDFSNNQILIYGFFAAVIAFAQPTTLFFRGHEATAWSNSSGCDQPRKFGLFYSSQTAAAATRSSSTTVLYTRQIAVVRTVLSSIRKQEKVISGLTLLQ